MSTYSFQSVQATVSGPGGNISVGNGSQAAEEGITIKPAGERNTRTLGADGSGMHSKHAAKAVDVTIRLLKTSPANAALMQMFNLQDGNVALWGANTITVRDTYRGDVEVCTQCAFVNPPTLTYAVEGGMNEWEFQGISYSPTLGTGQPALT